MPAAPGKAATALARRFSSPARMSIDEIMAEQDLLLAHSRTVQTRHACQRRRCDGQPHNGFPFAHAPRSVPEVSPLAEAQMLEPGYVERTHLRYLSDRLVKAMADVEGGQDRFMAVSMPPRIGKSEMISVNFPIWSLHKHPDWKIGLISHSPHLATSWGRRVRRVVEQRKSDLLISLQSDAGGVSNWETTRGGGVTSRSAPGQAITGLGFKVLVVDDPVKGWAEAQSVAERDAIWEWWLANGITRLESPSLVVVVQTRWHDDDFTGRLLSDEYDGDPDDWEVITFPALATEDDVLGRQPGDPLFTPLQAETREQALARWARLRIAVGSAAWAALYQQNPVPAEGAVYNIDAFRYWTTNPNHADEKHIVWRPEDAFGASGWLDSWDLTYKGGENSDYVVGQRWVRVGPDRILVGQARGQWAFLDTLARMREWNLPDSVGGSGASVHLRLVEDAANGSAILDTLSREVAGLKAIRPDKSKEMRARAITPEIESGNVYLPDPRMPGYEWVTDLLDELQRFPAGKHDDMSDALTQALSGLRDVGEDLPAVGPFIIEGGHSISSYRTTGAPAAGIRGTDGGFVGFSPL